MNMNMLHLKGPTSALSTGWATTQKAPVTGHELLAMLRRNALLVGACTVLVSAMALAMYKWQTPTYITSAQVLVQTDQLGTPSFLSGIAAYRESQFSESVNRKIETEMALIVARSNAARVMQRFGIESSHLPSSPWTQLGRRIKSLLHLPPAKVAGGPPAALLDAFIEDIGIEPVRSKAAETTSNVLEVRFESTDRELAPHVLGAMLDAYLEVGAQQSQRLGEATVNLLRSQLADAQRELKATEAELVALAIRDSAGRNLVADAAAAAGVQNGRRDAPNPANDSAISQMISQTLQLQSQLDDLRGTYTDQADSVRQLSKRVDASRARLASHMRASASASAEFSRLDRQRTLVQEHYVELRRKLEQIDLFMELTPAALNGRIIIDPPTLPTLADAHKKKTLITLGPAAGLLLGVLLASFREFMNPRLRSRVEVERALGLPMLGVVPMMELRR